VIWSTLYTQELSSRRWSKCVECVSCSTRRNTSHLAVRPHIAIIYTLLQCAKRGYLSVQTQARAVKDKKFAFNQAESVVAVERGRVGTSSRTKIVGSYKEVQRYSVQCHILQIHEGHSSLSI